MPLNISMSVSGTLHPDDAARASAFIASKRTEAALLDRPASSVFVTVNDAGSERQSLTLAVDGWSKPLVLPMPAERP
jgi:hypothetical protein